MRKSCFEMLTNAHSEILIQLSDYLHCSNSMKYVRCGNMNTVSTHYKMLFISFGFDKFSYGFFLCSFKLKSKHENGKMILKMEAGTATLNEAKIAVQLKAFARGNASRYFVAVFAFQVVLFSSFNGSALHCTWNNNTHIASPFSMLTISHQFCFLPHPFKLMQSERHQLKNRTQWQLGLENYCTISMEFLSK